MKKRVLATFAVLALSVSMLAGCSSEQEAAEVEDEAAPVEEELEEAEEKEEEKEEAKELETLTVAASPTPHAEILVHVKDELAEEGYDLQVTEFEDYIQPNEVVESGDFDANYFQHIPYLEEYNEEHGTHLVNAGGIHYEPMGIYPGTKSSLDEIADGDTIAVPNDTTNEARALLLLQDNGVLTLKEGTGLEATVVDIESYNYDIQIQEMEAAQVPRVIDEVAFAVINGNYALDAGLTGDKAAFIYESADSEAAQTYVNVIAVKEGNENEAKIEALVKALTSEETQKWIEEEYQGSVLPFTE